MSCLLKVLERMIYRRLIWFVETQFLLPEFQAGFRNSRFCMDNIVTLINRIHWGFLKKRSTIAVFLDIIGAFDNVIPSILFEELRDIGLPAKVCKFVENLLSERQIYSIVNGTLQPPLTSRKGIPQGSILSPIQYLPSKNFLHPPSWYSDPIICGWHSPLLQSAGYCFVIPLHLSWSSLLILATKRTEPRAS